LIHFVSLFIQPKEENDANEELVSDTVTGAAAKKEKSDIAADDGSQPVVCRRTGLIYPSSPMLQLLPTYDDGISSFSIMTSLLLSNSNKSHATNMDNVFCRICREGLHGDADDELPTAAADTDELPASSASSRRTTTTGTTAVSGASSTATTLLRRSPRLHPNRTNNANNPSVAVENPNPNRPMDVVVDEYEEEEEENRLLLDTEDNDDDMDVGLQHPPMFDDDDDDKVEEIFTSAGRTVPVATMTTTTTVAPRYVGPVVPMPQYSINTEALQNPMLKPCECSGSMAFVHYLCIEQWRCRSRHPNALHGLNCETCNKPYSLPPPTERRPTHNMEGMILQDENGQLIFPNNMIDNNDWLDAMPPHVMQALRQPHIWWQIGAYIVRKRYLRPLVPVIMSPIVALYCRARRLLKKRGVARRRWACSLCRRRARWKCVRCLRSYYCSRQCQNVSWHIIHKHVCYKPSRFWSSIVFYGLLTLFLLPGIVRDPLMYDIIVCIIPLSFVIMGILGGGIATVIKKSAGYDVRGRTMELLVVLATIWLSMMTWGLVQAFFSLPQPTCYGTLGTFNITQAELFPNLYSNATCHDPTTTDVVDIPTSTLTATMRALLSMVRSIMIWNLRLIHICILQPAQMVYKMWDRIFLHSRLRPILCTKGSNHRFVSNISNRWNSTSFLGSESVVFTAVRALWNRNDMNRNSTDTIASTIMRAFGNRKEHFPSETDLRTNGTSTMEGMHNQTARTGCFEHISNANANFILSVLDGNNDSENPDQMWMNQHHGQCASDLLLVFTLYGIALITLVGSILYKQHERRQRQQNQVRMHHIHPRQRHRPIFEVRRNQRHLHQA
jgi:RING-variant domain